MTSRLIVSAAMIAAVAVAPSRGWVVVSMKNDWKQVFKFQRGHRTTRHT